MKMKNPMLVVTDIDKSVEFYKKVLGLHVIMDFGANKTLTGGLALQTLESWQEFIETGDVLFASNSSEVYFEEDNFDKFADKLKKCQTAHCGRYIPHFDFGAKPSPIVPYRHLPQSLSGMTADCRSLV